MGEDAPSPPRVNIWSIAPTIALSNAVIDPLNQINLFFLSNRKSCAFGDCSGYNRPSGFQFSENLIFRMENGT